MDIRNEWILSFYFLIFDERYSSLTSLASSKSSLSSDFRFLKNSCFSSGTYFNSCIRSAYFFFEIARPPGYKQGKLHIDNVSSVVVFFLRRIFCSISSLHLTFKMNGSSLRYVIMRNLNQLTFHLPYSFFCSRLTAEVQRTKWSPFLASQLLGTLVHSSSHSWLNQPSHRCEEVIFSLSLYQTKSSITAIITVTRNKILLLNNFKRFIWWNIM